MSLNSWRRALTSTSAERLSKFRTVDQQRHLYRLREVDYLACVACSPPYMRDHLGDKDWGDKPVSAGARANMRKRDYSNQDRDSDPLAH